MMRSPLSTFTKHTICRSAVVPRRSSARSRWWCAVYAQVPGKGEEEQQLRQITLQSPHYTAVFPLPAGGLMANLNASRPHCGGKFSEQLHGFVPSDTGVGDALPVDERFPIYQFLGTRDQIAL